MRLGLLCIQCFEFSDNVEWSQGDGPNKRIPWATVPMKLLMIKLIMCAIARCEKNQKDHADAVCGTSQHNWRWTESKKRLQTAETWSHTTCRRAYVTKLFWDQPCLDHGFWRRPTVLRVQDSEKDMSLIRPSNKTVVSSPGRCTDWVGPWRSCRVHSRNRPKRWCESRCLQSDVQGQCETH